MIKNLPSIERNSDDALPRMTPKQKREAVKLIRELCSYHDDGNCLYLDRGESVTCPQSISYSVNCKFFRHVLLKDKAGEKLEAEIFDDKAAKHCTICGELFQSKSNNAKYCKACAETVRRKQKAEYAKKRRHEVER